MAEHEEELLLRGSMEVPPATKTDHRWTGQLGEGDFQAYELGKKVVEKPWTPQREAELLDEDHQLLLTERFLENQLIDIRRRRTAIRAERLQGHLGQSSELPPDMGLPPIPDFSTKGVTRGFRNKLMRPIPLPIASPGEPPVHFPKPYDV